MKIAKQLLEYLNKHIIENEFAKELIVDAISYRFGMTQEAQKQLSITFLLAGDHATGKTHTAKIVADFFNTQNSYRTFTLDLSAYKSYNSGGDINGSEKTYNNSGPGKLTTHLCKYPQSCIILENFDKAHHNVQEVFISALQQGYIRDSYGFTFENDALTNDNYDEKLSENRIIFEIPCENSIFILTTLEGKDFYKKTTFMEQLKTKESAIKDIFLESVLKRNHVNDTSTIGFSPSIASVLQGVFFIPMIPLGFQPTSLLLERHIASLKTISGCALHVKDAKSIAQALVLSSGPQFNLQKILNTSQQKLLDPLLDHLREDNSIATKVRISMDEASKNILQSLIKEIGEEKILKMMFQKNLRLDISITCKDFNFIFDLKLHINPILQKSFDPSNYTGTNKGFIFQIPEVSFEDIAGHKQAKSKLKEVINYLKNPKELQRFGISMPKGMLLYGPPGSGKTMLAKAFAHEADLPFIATTGTDLLSIETMNEIFKRANEYAPSIIFIDEIDAIGHRDGSAKDPLINYFLTELNGFSDNPEEMVFIIAATNFKEKLDPAIVRSGRLDMHIEIPALDAEARAYFIDKILEKPTNGTFDKDKLVMFTSGMSGADLQKIAREVSIDAIRKGLKGFTHEMIIEQINILKYGERICSIGLEKTMQAVSYHEAGHAVISKALLPDLKIEQIVVSPRNNALGFVAYNFEGEYNNLTYEEIKNRICIAYAGRIAQIEKFGQKGLDSGAQNDIDVATNLACYAITSLGMDEELGYVNFKTIKHILGNGHTDTLVQERICHLLDTQKKRTEVLIKEHWTDIESVAKVLMKEEFLHEKKFYSIIKKVK